MITPFRKYSSIDLDIDKTAKQKLDNLASEYNMTVDEVCRHLLLDQISTVIEIKDCSQISIDTFIKYNKFIIFTKEGKPIARLTPI
jgi:hypothetical protein